MFACDKCGEPGTSFFKFYGDVLCESCMDDAMSAAEEANKEE